MKKIITLLLFSFFIIGCSDDDLKEENVLVGKWKLIKIGYFNNNEYAPKNNGYVYYTFTNTNTVVIESNVSLPTDDISYQYTNPKIVPYSYHNDNDFLMTKVVQLGNSGNNDLGQYGFKIDGNHLKLYEYDGKVISFEKAQ